ncbi:putative vacuolar import/degradation Vid27 [Helianthus annuus]|uniref:Vacuolar import/degradation Vid27 n=1 Tax=Helianthus annuus TaxID=4232 RepID=A0A9K3N7V6_HELAN|nr:putative vacuolar import/degradation Vid27 [Helianthus annuus]
MTITHVDVTYDGKWILVTSDGKQERHLVATVGKFNVIWNFQQVKDGSHKCYRNQVGLKSCYCYKIVPKDDLIVDSHFMHEKFAVSDSPEAPLVVSTPMKVNSFSIWSSRLSYAYSLVFVCFLIFLAVNSVKRYRGKVDCTLVVSNYIVVMDLWLRRT